MGECMGHMVPQLGEKHSLKFSVYTIAHCYNGCMGQAGSSPGNPQDCDCGFSCTTSADCAPASGGGLCNTCLTYTIPFVGTRRFCAPSAETFEGQIADKLASEPQWSNTTTLDGTPFSHEILGCYHLCVVGPLGEDESVSACIKSCQLPSPLL
jgi:hypothetical protein